MKRYIHSSEELMYNSYLKPDEWLPALNLKPSEVKGNLLDNIAPEDKEIIQYLIDSRIIPTCASSKDLRTNPYYDLEDKFIRIYKDTDDFRCYYVPYAGTGRFGTGRIFENSITVYNDGTVQFGQGKIRDLHEYAPSTLKKCFFNGK